MRAGVRPSPRYKLFEKILDFPVSTDFQVGKSLTVTTSNMDYHLFPSHRPNEVSITSLNKVLAGDLMVGESMGGVVSIRRMKVDENWEETSVSSFYEKYLKLVIFCFYSLALVLRYWDNLKPAGASMKAKSWITLAQHFIYIEQTLATFFSAAREGGWRCDSFDRFLVTELVVKRHEPIYVYAYRASRKDGQPNISTYPLDRLSECSLFFPIPN